jgi:hypothetical protein
MYDTEYDTASVRTVKVPVRVDMNQLTQENLVKAICLKLVTQVAKYILQHVLCAHSVIRAEELSADFVVHATVTR